ncbi:MAG: aryl-sulfate sulfotransferase, partial [candidate division WOR-3 bacterium]
GNVVMIAYETWTKEEAIEAGRRPYLVPEGLKTEYLVEVDTATGEIVWEWHSWDHLVQDFDSTKRNYGVVRDHPELIDINYYPYDNRDIMHLNSVDYNAEFDQLLVSPREYQEAWVIDHSTTTEEARGHSGGRYGQGGDLLYRWGNPSAYRRGDTAYHRLVYQHDPQWIPDSLQGAGRMLAFSNGGDRLREWSSVDEWEPPVDSLGFYSLGPDSVFGPDTITWWFRDTLDFYSVRISGCQRLPNGNTLVCEGMSGEMFEVTPDSELVWYYISPVCSSGPMHQGETIPHWGNTVFRCYRYSPGFSGFAGHNLEPGDPIELPPLGISSGRFQEPGLSLAVRPRVLTREAWFDIELAETQRARLAVYDAAGCRVASVFDRQLDIGRHTFLWRARALAAGSYFCALTTESGTLTRSILVTR